NGQSVSALDGKTARDCGAAPVNRLVDVGRGEDLAVENDGEGLVDVLARQPGKALSALRIERDRDDRLVGLRIEGLLRVGQRVAADTAEAAHGNRSALARAALGKRDDFASRRRNALRDVRRQRALIDQLEFELSGLAEQILKLLRILEAGHLHDDAVRALADDCRLARSERVDALAHDFGRAFHRVRDREVEAGTGLADDEAAAVDDLDGPVTLPGQPGAGGQRLEDVARSVDLAGIFEQEREAVARGGDVTNAN